MIRVILPSSASRMKALGAKTLTSALATGRRKPTTSVPAAPAFRNWRRDSPRRSRKAPMMSGIPRLLSDAGSFFDRRADADVGSAAADVARHRGINVRIVRPRCRCEQRCGRHDLSGLAVTTLDDFEIEPGFLDLGAGLGSADAFDRGDLSATDRTDRQQARAHRLTVEMDGAGAALGDAATKLGAGHAEHIAKHPQERRVGGHVDGARLAVNIQRNHGVRLPSDSQTPPTLPLSCAS